MSSAVGNRLKTLREMTEGPTVPAGPSVLVPLGHVVQDQCARAGLRGAYTYGIRRRRELIGVRLASA